MWTYRIKYTKLGRIRFISHLDVMRALIRALNRASIPVVYSEGFNPRPKISLGPALPLGYESNCELVDIVLARRLRPEDVHQRLATALPQGINLHEIRGVMRSSPRLSQASSACYVIELPEGEIGDNADLLVAEFFRRDSVLVKRVRKDTSSEIDVKQFVMDARVVTEGGSRWLGVEISMGGQGTFSASGVAQAVLNLSPESTKCLRIMRTEIKFDGRPVRVKTNEKSQEEESQKKH